MTAVVETARLSNKKTMHILQLELFNKTEFLPGPSLLITKDGAFENRWLKVKGDSYCGGNFVGFEMIPTSECSSASQYCSLIFTVDLEQRPPHAFGKSSGSSQSFAIAKQWIQTCLDHHQPTAADESSFFPWRVLDIGGRGYPIVKLKSRTWAMSAVADAKYATLSYCWGQGNHLKLEWETLIPFLRGIYVAKLPKTMRDAIAVTRELGLRFLWIDSLCIIQNSQEDWRTQSAMMGSIYQHSHINLAASSSTDSEGGLFFDRDPSSIRPVEVICRLPVQESAIPDEDSDIPAQLCKVLLQKPYYQSIEKAHLNSRGWVLQERLLARRTLHFTKDQLFWECEHMLANESHPEGIETALDRPPGEFRRMLNQFLDGEGTESHEVKWLSLVGQYTRCNLTRDSDILIALSGLARRWSEVFPDQYLAGIWEQSLEKGLLWHAEALDYSLPEGEVAPCWRAPSWSWASFKGPVYWCPEVLPHSGFRNGVISSKSLIQLISTDLVSAFKDPFGQLKSGSITVRGVLADGSSSADSLMRASPQGGNDGNDWLSQSMKRSVAHGSSSRSFAIHSKHGEYTGYCYFDGKTLRKKLGEGPSGRLTCLPIVLRLVTSKGAACSLEASLQLQGILLEVVREDGVEEPRYKRVGYFSAKWQCPNEEDGRDLFDDLDSSNFVEIAEQLGLGQVKETILI